MTGVTRYRRDIDGLRAIAVGSVILNHFDRSAMPSGYLGVDIFFVISGYVITLSLRGREVSSLRDFLLGFYGRRCQRLLPALIACTAVTSVLISLFNPDPVETLKTGICALFGVANLYLLRIADDYFGGPSQLNGFTHTWSLGVEEQFYALFPLILWLLLRRPGRAGMKTFAAVIAAMAALSLAAFVVIGGHRPMAAFYLMPLRFWELATGCLVALARDHAPARAQRRWAENAVIGLIMVALVLPAGFALFANIAVVALTALALAILAPGSLAYAILTSRIAAYLGMVSYSLYLWHWPVLVLGRYTIGLRGWSVPMLVATILLAAHLSYHRLEHPLRTRAWAASDGRTVLWGVSAAGLAAGCIAILAGPLAGRLYTGRPAQLAARTIASLSDAYRIAGTSYRWAGGRCILASNADAGKDIPRDPCTLGRFEAAPRRVMVFGNSFAASFVHGFDALVKDDHYAVTITSAWGASPIAEVPNHTPWARSNAYYWDTLVPLLVAQLRPGDWVLLISDVSAFAPQHATATARQDLALYRQGLARFSAQLARSGLRLAVLDANPFIRDSGCGPDTAVPQWFIPGGPPCHFLTKADTLARRQPVDAMLRQMQHDHQLIVIDPLPIFCPGETCTFLGNDHRVLYRDEFSHPSIEAAAATAPLFRAALTRAAPAW